MIPDTLTANGFCTPRDTGTYGPPDPAEVAIAKRWIALYCQPRKTINTRLGSYLLKHVIESWNDGNPNQRGYVSNGACIQAFIESGYQYKAYPPNACFNVQYVGPKVKRSSGHRDIPLNTWDWQAALPGEVLHAP